MHNDVVSTSIEYATMYNYHIKLSSNPVKDIKMLNLHILKYGKIWTMIEMVIIF